MRGDVYALPDNRRASGHVQRGERFCIVVQNDDLMLSTWLVAPTSTSAQDAPWRPEVDVNGKTTKVLAEQTLAVDPQRLGRQVARLSLAEMTDVDNALRLVLGLRP